MKASEVRDLTTAELESKLKDLKAELFNLRFQLAINQLDNPIAHLRCKEGHRAREDGSARERDQGQREGVTEGRINCERS